MMILMIMITQILFNMIICQISLILKCDSFKIVDRNLLIWFHLFNTFIFITIGTIIKVFPCGWCTRWCNYNSTSMWNFWNRHRAIAMIIIIAILLLPIIVSGLLGNFQQFNLIISILITFILIWIKFFPGNGNKNDSNC